MIVTEEIFQHFCSTAASPIGYGILDYVKAEINSAMGALRAFVGETVFANIPDMDMQTYDPTDGDQQSMSHAYAYVCQLAFYNAIPSLDLTLSQAGFGIVSNANVAPASSERVERLRSQMRAASEDSFDNLAHVLRGNADWHDTPMAKRHFSTLIWRGSQMAQMGYVLPHRKELIENRSGIASAEIDLKNRISPEFFCELTEAVRHNSVTSAQQVAIDLCQTFICAHVAETPRDVTLARRALLAVLDDNIDSYPTYKNSKAYEANHYKPYENAKDDPCYFFG